MTLSAATWEFMGGASTTSYDDIPEYNDTGASILVRRIGYDGKGKKHGIHLMGEFPGITPLSIYTLTAGYGYKTSGPFFLEVAAGFYYGSIWGRGISALVGIGYSWGRWHVSLPIVLQGSLFMKAVPMIGITF